MAITPTKYVPMQYSLMGVAAHLLSEMQMNDTVSSFWERVKLDPQIRTFDRFADGLTILFAIGSISLEGGVLSQRRAARHA